MTDDPLSLPELDAPTCDTCGTVVEGVICGTCEKDANVQRSEARTADGLSSSLTTQATGAIVKLSQGSQRESSTEVDTEGLATAKVERTIWADGDMFLVQGAKLQDGTSPADELFADLKEMVWPDPDIDEYPDDRQADTRGKLLATIEQFANGYVPRRTAYNRLRVGLWEFKEASVRLTYFTTGGDGGYDKVEGSPGVVGYKLYPEDLNEMNENVRLGHHFAKDGKLTPEPEILAAERVREEDLEHDQ